MTFMPMVRVLAGPVERPFRYLLDCLDPGSLARFCNATFDHMVPAVFAKDPQMTFKPMAGVLAWPIERPFRYLLLASVLAPLVCPDPGRRDRP